MHFEYKIGLVIHYVYSLECFKEVTSPSLPLSLHSAPYTPCSLQLILYTQVHVRGREDDEICGKQMASTWKD